MKNTAPSFTRMLVTSLTLCASAMAFQVQAANPIATPSAPAIAAEGYVLMDYHSGQVIAEKNMNERRHPASLTKMLTSYVIGQEMKAGNITPQDEVVISENAWAKNFPDSSKMFIEVGTTVTVDELNHGIIIQSGNDACVAMAEHIAGSEDAFVDLMNSWAKKIGMTQSHFTNVHGLDNPDLYSTPYDLALLGRALIKDVPNEYKLYAEKKFTYNGITQYNRNGLLWDRSLNVDGIKTGHTSGAGYNLVSSATEGDMRLVAVVMGTKSENARKAESKKLLSYGFRFFETVSPHQANKEFIKERVWLGDKDEISLGLAQDTFVTLQRGQAKNLSASFQLDGELKAPIKKGDKVGTVFYQLNGEDIANYPLVALEDVNEGSFFSRMWDMLIKFFSGLFK